MKPSFKKREIVIAKPKEVFNLGGDKKEIIAEVLYVGAEQQYYKPGDKVLYIHSSSYNDKGIKTFGEELLRFDDERYVICAIEE